MNLLRELAAALNCNRQSIEPLFGRYVVGDLCTMQPAPTILVLESPHDDEVAHGYPAAGTTGSAITSALRRNVSIEATLEQSPLGSILQRCPRTLRLGLMNASRLPLQIKVYRQEHIEWYGWDRIQSEFLCFLLQTLRQLQGDTDERQINDLLSNEADNHASRVYRVLLNDLKFRLESLPRGALVVPCGKVARNLVDRVASLDGYEGTAEIRAQIGDKDIPHPVVPGWSKLDVVTSLVDIIRKRAGLPQ